MARTMDYFISLVILISMINLTISIPERNSQINRRRTEIASNNNFLNTRQNSGYIDDPDRVIFPDDDYNVNSRRASPPNRNNNNVPVKNTTRNEMPLDLALRLNELGDVSAFMEEYLENKDEFRYENRFSALSEGVSLTIGGRFGSVTKSTKGGFSPKPVCSPVMTTIRLAPENHPSNVLFLPECAHVKRCSGCCNTPLLSCQPIKTSNVTFKVFENILLSHKKKLRYNRSYDVEVEEHLSCGCKCRVQAHHCQPTQRYESQSCRCVCNGDVSEGRDDCEASGKIWDDFNCSCNCPEDTSQDCSSQSIFNENICSCI